MESALRPRDIQARIRAGETPEAVAEAAQTTVERIMPFAGPVLDERAHVAGKAQSSSVRRRAGESGARTLGDAVAALLRRHRVDPDTVGWDAWRRDDGRWALAADFGSAERSGRAMFTFDPGGNYVTPEDDDARWLVGDAAAAEPRPDDLTSARRRRLQPLPDELPLGDDALEMVSEDGPRPVGDAQDPGGVGPGQEPAQPGGRPGADPEGQPGVEPGVEPIAEPSPPPAPEREPDPAADAARRPARRKGRASVPTWDEIMFGGGKQD